MSVLLEAALDTIRAKTAEYSMLPKRQLWHAFEI